MTGYHNAIIGPLRVHIATEEVGRDKSRTARKGAEKMCGFLESVDSVADPEGFQGFH